MSFSLQVLGGHGALKVALSGFKLLGRLRASDFGWFLGLGRQLLGGVGA